MPGQSDGPIPVATEASLGERYQFRIGGSEAGEYPANSGEAGFVGYGYAPGNYQFKCYKCEKIAVGAKSCSRCLNCAQQERDRVKAYWIAVQKNAEENKAVPGRHYRHFRGNYYIVELIAKNCDDASKEMVIYRRLDGGTAFWSRRREEFEGLSDEGSPRFVALTSIADINAAYNSFRK